MQFSSSLPRVPSNPTSLLRDVFVCFGVSVELQETPAHEFSNIVDIDNWTKGKQMVADAESRKSLCVMALQDTNERSGLSVSASFIHPPSYSHDINCIGYCFSHQLLLSHCGDWKLPEARTTNLFHRSFSQAIQMFLSLSLLFRI